MTKENKTKVEDLKTIQETEDNQTIELSDKDLDNIVGGSDGQVKLSNKEFSDSQLNPYGTNYSDSDLSGILVVK